MLKNVWAPIVNDVYFSKKLLFWSKYEDCTFTSKLHKQTCNKKAIILLPFIPHKVFLTLLKTEIGFILWQKVLNTKYKFIHFLSF